MTLKKVKGTYDVLPEESFRWQALEAKIRELMEHYYYKEMRTPIFEYKEVFHRQSEQSDMVQKETYDFFDRANREITLRPEGTAGIIRSYVENKRHANPDLEKVYYIGPNFRYERPQKGRYRQFYQFGVEAIGAENPGLDAELIVLAYDLIKKIGLRGAKVRINTLGDTKSRAAYKNALIEHFKPHQDTLCADCQNRLINNPLRILDCKIDAKHNAVLSAPSTQTHLTPESKAYFKAVLDHLDVCNVHYEINNRLVRGLDYYGHTVFEVEADIEGFGAQNVLCGGGRYQHLVKELGGPDISGIGFAFGMERLLSALESEGIELGKEIVLDAYVIKMNDKHTILASKIVNDLRNRKLIANLDYQNKSFKAQLKEALRHQAKFLIILGDDEVNQKMVALKNTKTEQQENVLIDQVGKIIKERLE